MKSVFQVFLVFSQLYSIAYTQNLMQKWILEWSLESHVPVKWFIYALDILLAVHFVLFLCQKPVWWFVHLWDYIVVSSFLKMDKSKKIFSFFCHLLKKYYCPFLVNVLLHTSDLFFEHFHQKNVPKYLTTSIPVAVGVQGLFEDRMS